MPEKVAEAAHASRDGASGDGEEGGLGCPPVTLDITSSSGLGYEICALESAFLSGSSNSVGKSLALS